MPYSIVIRCFPKTDLPVTGAQGKNLQGVFLDLTRKANPKLSAALHKGDELRGYTVSPLFKGKSFALNRHAKPDSKEIIRAGTPCWVRYTLLDGEIYSAFMKHLLSEKGTPGFSLGETKFLIGEVLSTPESGDKWAGYISPEELWNRASSENLTFRFEAVAPVVFKQGDLNLPLPLPVLFFKSLLAKWNKSYPHLTINERIRETFERNVGLMEFRLRSEVWEDTRTKYHGFIGKFSFYGSKKLSPEEVKALNLLSDFAFYSGVGAKTTMSLGMVRRI